MQAPSGFPNPAHRAERGGSRRKKF